MYLRRIIRLSAIFLAALGGGFAVHAAPPSARQPVLSPETRPLYTYHRDDAAPVTTIHLDAARQGAIPESPYVFGNFIEQLFNVVYNTLWADALNNPNLERSDAGNREPPFWDQTGAASWKEEGGYLSPSSVRLSGPDGTLSQRVFLPVQRERRYTLTLYARAPSGAGQITLSVRAGSEQEGPFQAGEEKAGQAVVQTPLAIGGGDWQMQTVHWTIPADILAKGQTARFVIAHAGGADVDVDQIDLMPDDNVDGMDPDTLKAAQAWHIPILRMAGNFSSQYHWRDGVGPMLSRPSRPNAAWGNVILSNHFGTDEYLDLCRRLGATPQIGVNAGNGTPDEAAAWVHYCNDKAERVPVWEIGNELYGGWQIGHTDAPGNAARYVQFRDAMLQADPRLKLIATGKGDEFSPDGIGRDRDWNLAVLNAAIANGGQAPDWLSIHPLVGLPGDTGGLPYDQKWESAMAHPAFLDKTLLPELIREIQSVEGPHARTRIAPTEWGLILTGDGWQNGPNHDVEAGAIYNALALNTFLRYGDWVTLANVTALLHGGCIARDHGVVYVKPEYYTGQLYAAAAPHTPIAADWSGPGRDVPQYGFLPGTPDVPDVDVFSALTVDRARLVLFAVNRTLNGARPVHIAMDGFPAGHVSATVLTSDDPQAGNSWEHPGNVAPQTFPVPPGSAHAGWTVALPPHSLVVFTFSR